MDPAQEPDDSAIPPAVAAGSLLPEGRDVPPTDRSDFGATGLAVYPEGFSN